MNSLSDYMLTHVTSFRNEGLMTSAQQWDQKGFPITQPRLITRSTAQIAYLLIIPFTLVESLFALITSITLRLACVDPEDQDRVNRWLSSSSFSIVRTSHHAVTNLFVDQLI